MQGERGKAAAIFSLPAIESEASNKHQANSSKGNTLGDRAQCSGAAIVYTWSNAVAIVHPGFGSGTGISKQTAKLTCSPVAQLDRRCGGVVCAVRGAGRQACGVGGDLPRYSTCGCKFFLAGSIFHQRSQTEVTNEIVRIPRTVQMYSPGEF